MFEKELDKIVDVCRESRTNDIVKRLGVITSNRIHLKRYPLDNPTVVFNPSMIIKQGIVILYARVTLGYYTYTSTVAELRIPLEDVYDNLTLGNYAAEIKIFPDNKFDIYGIEDPRVYEIDGKRYMTYCGRTVNYFDPNTRIERTLPITAVLEDDKWRKLGVFRMLPKTRESVVSDKNAFLVKTKHGLKFFHRLHMEGAFYAVISNVPDGVLNSEGFNEVNLNDTMLAIKSKRCEDKIGWGPPPVKIGKEYVFLLHGVDKNKHYRVFAMLTNEKLEITAISPGYIMGPKEIYEIFGDRPFVVFPCGAQKIDDKILISYGAADLAIGIGEIDTSDLMSILDSNRID